MDLINEHEVRGFYDSGYIRGQIADKMKMLKLSDKEITEISIVINTLCSNIVKHNAVNGKIRYFQINAENRVEIEIISEDKVQGINTSEVQKDNVSNKGTIDDGFESINNFSDFFEISSNTEYVSKKGMPVETMLTVRLWSMALNDTSAIGNSEIKVSVISRPYTGFSVNGDCYYIRSLEDRDIIAVVDGLGHGRDAHKAASHAVKIIEENTQNSIEDIIKQTNTALKNTRGAVIALFIVYKFTNEFEMISIGNIDCRHIVADSTVKLLSYNGYVGAYSGSCKSRKHIYSKGDMLVLCSDGISSKWEVGNYAEGVAKSPSLLCNMVFNEYERHNDDATILVAVL